MPIMRLRFLKNVFFVCLFSILLSTGCQKKEEPKVQVPPPSGPVYAEKEIRLLEDGARQNPGKAVAWTKLGNALMDAHRYQKAIDAYQKALELDQKNIDVRVDMGTCFKNMGQFDGAVEEYRKAIAVDPGHVNAHRNLGVVLGFDLGDKKGAIKELEESLKLSPYGPGADTAKKMIEELKRS